VYRIANETSSNLRAIFANTASRRGISSAIIEKDFWVCFLLRLKIGTIDSIFSRAVLRSDAARPVSWFPRTGSRVWQELKEREEERGREREREGERSRKTVQTRGGNLFTFT